METLPQTDTSSPRPDGIGPRGRSQEAIHAYNRIMTMSTTSQQPLRDSRTTIMRVRQAAPSRPAVHAMRPPDASSAQHQR
eukprot:5317659-Prymnesium_polylepis.1